MAKLKNYTLGLDYPIYGAKFLNDNTLLVAGGGGEGNNGIPNKMTVIAVQPSNAKKPLKRYRELVLNEKEDCVMSLDGNNGVILAGINENTSMMRKGVNKHLRKFKFVNDHLKFVQSCQIHANANSTMYQKLTAVSSDGTSSVIVMSDNPSTVYIIDSNEDLEEKFKIMTDGDVKDISISPDGKMMCYITSNTFEAISMVTGRSVFKTNQIDLLMSRVRFINNDEVIICCSKDSNAHVIKYSIAKSKIVMQKMVCKQLRGTTSMDISNASDLIAISTSDYSILLVRIKDLKLVKKLTHVHKFAITKVTFSNDGKYLASGSAANTVNVIEIPEGFANSKSTIMTILMNILMIIIIGLFSVVVQYLYKKGHLTTMMNKSVQMYQDYQKKDDSSKYFVVNDEIDDSDFTRGLTMGNNDIITTGRQSFVSEGISVTSVTYSLILPSSEITSEKELTSVISEIVKKDSIEKQASSSSSISSSATTATSARPSVTSTIRKNSDINEDIGEPEAFLSIPPHKEVTSSSTSSTKSLISSSVSKSSTSIVKVSSSSSSVPELISESTTSSISTKSSAEVSSSVSTAKPVSSSDTNSPSIDAKSLKPLTSEVIREITKEITRVHVVTQVQVQIVTSIVTPEPSIPEPSIPEPAIVEVTKVIDLTSVVTKTATKTELQVTVVSSNAGETTRTTSSSNTVAEPSSVTLAVEPVRVVIDSAKVETVSTDSTVPVDASSVTLAVEPVRVVIDSEKVETVSAVSTVSTVSTGSTDSTASTVSTTSAGTRVSLAVEPVRVIIDSQSAAEPSSVTLAVEPERIIISGNGSSVADEIVKKELELTSSSTASTASTVSTATAKAVTKSDDISLAVEPTRIAAVSNEAVSIADSLARKQLKDEL